MTWRQKHLVVDVLPEAVITVADPSNVAVLDAECF